MNTPGNLTTIYIAHTQKKLKKSIVALVASAALIGIKAMKKTLLLLTAVALSVSVSAQAGKTLAATMDVYVFPAAGQDQSKQAQHEVACYEWAVGNTGSDPFALSKQESADQQSAQTEMQAAEQAGSGRTAGGVVRGAAAGALIGEIASDDAGKGAAWGAALGGVRGRRQAAYAQQEAKQEATGQAEQREQATAKQLENFKKAFSVCLEAKEYMVKY